MYNKSPEYKIGTEPRNTLDVNNKYDHYFRKDIDVKYPLPSLIPTKQIKSEEFSQKILDLGELLGSLSNKKNTK